MSDDTGDLLGRMNATLDGISAPSSGFVSTAAPGIATVTAGSGRSAKAQASVTSRSGSAFAGTARGVTVPASLQRSSRQVASALRRALSSS